MFQLLALLFLNTSRAATRPPKWRELIKKVWEADPLLCPHCQKKKRIVSLCLIPAFGTRISGFGPAVEYPVRSNAAGFGNLDVYPSF